MKKYVVLILLFMSGITAYACPVCERQQPEILRGITHGAGPDSRWDYLIITIAVLIVLVTLFYSVKWLIRPGERSTSHIKFMILNAE